jgi:hypothetical protein
MRQFTVIVKFAVQTGQTEAHRVVPSLRKVNLRAIAIKHFALDNGQYFACYARARTFLRSIRNSATSDDMIAALKQAA